jgi:hypothetical protein
MQIVSQMFLNPSNVRGAIPENVLGQISLSDDAARAYYSYWSNSTQIAGSL